MTSQAPTSLAAAAGLPKIDYGRGCRLYDTNGKCYIDGSAGPAVFSLGHAHPEVNAAIVRQLDRIAHGYRFTFTSDPLEELTALVAEGCGGRLRHMTFCSSGSEAIESCLKIALQYHAANGAPLRQKFISRERSWHGNTLGALSISGFAARRERFEGVLIDGSRLSPVNTYRPPPNVAAEQVAAFCAAELEQEIHRLGAERVAGFVFEPVVGAAGGCVPAPPGYAQRVRDICDRTGVLMIADEVMCGSGRSGSFFRALETDGVVPDIMAVAKGLAGGYVPLSAAIYHDRLHGVLMGDGGLRTGHTFSGHTLACAAGVAVQTIVRRDGLLQKVTDDGAYLRAALGHAFGKHPHVGDVRGRGLFLALELVRDRATRQPFPASLGLHARVREAAMANGLVCYPVGGNVDGVDGDVVILSPPYIVTRDELDEIVDKLACSLDEAVTTVRRSADTGSS